MPPAEAIPTAAAPIGAGGAAEHRGPTSDGALVDTHVHIYDCFDLDAFLDAAERNFGRWSRGGAAGGPAGVLMLTETAADDQFARLAGMGERAGGAWGFRPTAEPCSLLAVRAGAPRLAIVAGRQIVARERLEALALGCQQRIEDGLPLSDTIERALEAGAIAVIPWGFGKWWGGRGRLVRALLEGDFAGRFFLGDNSGRPAASAAPRLMGEAALRSIRTLPGSDPLPFPAQAVNAGRYGAVLGGVFDWERPFASVKAMLEDGSGPIQAYGRRESLARFCRYQVAMQLRKRRRGAVS